LDINELPGISGGGRRRRAWRRICHLKDEAFAVVLEASMVKALINVVWFVFDDEAINDESFTMISLITVDVIMGRNFEP
jgi:hypothetical protein